MNMSPLFFILLLLSFNAFGLSQVWTPPQNCVDVGGVASKEAQCCPELKFENGQCAVPTPTQNYTVCADPVAPNKLSLTQCPLVSGMQQGCYPQREENVFPDPADNSSQPESNNDEARSDDGDACKLNSHCESFRCEPKTAGSSEKVCRERLVCRLAEVGEVILPNINPDTACEAGSKAGIEKDQETSANQRVCVQNPDRQISPSIASNLFKANQCSYQILPDMKNRRIVAMTTVRAMEFLFAHAENDPMRVREYLREKVAKPLYEKRKTALFEFNLKLKNIEADELLIKTASKTSEKLIKIHETESLKEKELAIRRASGKDAIKIMKRRNELSMAFETAMYLALSEASKNMKPLAENMAKWRAKDKKWTIAEGETRFKDISSGKKIQKSYASRHRVKPKTAFNNNEVFNKSGVSSFFQLLAEGGSANALPKKKFYLLDAPFPKGGGNSFGQPGNEQNNLTGTGKDALSNIHDSFRAKIADYYRGIKPGATPDFVFEPELVNLGEKNCLDQLVKAPTAPVSVTPVGTAAVQPTACTSFNTFVDGLQDTAFAEFIAFSAHKSGKYKKFFEKEGTLRRRLVKTLDVELQNLTKYYEELKINRLAQNGCYDRAYGYIESHMKDGDTNKEVITDRPTGGANGGKLASGSSRNQIGSAGEISGLAGSEGSGNNQAFNNSQNSRNQKVSSPDFSLPSLSNTNSTMVGNQSSSQASSASGSEAGLAEAQAASSNAISRKKLTEENNLARAANPGAAEKRDKEIVLAYNSLGAGLSGPGSSSSGSSEGSLSSLSGSAKLMDDEKKAASEMESDLNADKNNSGTSLNISEGQFASGPQAPGSSSESMAKAAISDEDTDVMMANLERTRSQYDAKEEDELFDKVSKAYVRNLDKVLKRKSLD